MKHMLVLARGNAHGFFDLAGRSVLGDIPCRLTVYTNDINAPAFAQSGEHVRVERVRWSDTAQIEQRVAALHAADPLHAIGVLDEKVMDLAAALRQRLGINGLHTQEAARFRDKPTMKRLLGVAGVRVPEFVDAGDRPAVLRLLHRHGRIVVKPNDGLGSREVSFIDGPVELQDWYAAHADAQGFEAEEFVDGVLYHVNAVVHRGVPLLTAAAPYLPGMANIDFASGSPFVSVMLDEDDLKRRLQAMSDRVIEVLGLVDGVTHMECFVTAEGEIVFCEIAARPGGGGIVGMIEAQYGVNFARAALLLEAGFGERVMPPSQPAPDTLAGLIGFRLPRSGFLRRVPAAIDFGDDWIRAVTIDHEPGGFIAAAAHCTDFVGSFVFVARDRGHFDERRVELTQRFNKALEVEPV
ncbi:MAG: ATP-grasp domain-containing protein [Rubrivivax sp.]|nr:ATP-grasp domain-containing protein [Rubrivivax sp.]